MMESLQIGFLKRYNLEYEYRFKNIRIECIESSIELSDREFVPLLQAIKREIVHKYIKLVERRILK